MSLLFPIRNTGGKKTPQDDTVQTTPNLRRIDEIENLLTLAIANCTQLALKDLIRFG
jgi:hypothetical protein